MEVGVEKRAWRSTTGCLSHLPAELEAEADAVGEGVDKLLGADISPPLRRQAPVCGGSNSRCQVSENNSVCIGQ